MKCFVTSEGEFTISIPEELSELVYRVKMPLGVGINKARSDAPARVYCDKLDEGLYFLKQCAIELLNVEEKTERVIVYKAEFNLSFWKMPDGRIRGNGSGANAGKWHTLHFENKGTHAHNRTDMFSVGLCAAVFDKVTTIRKSGNVIRYIDPKDLKDGSPAANLNSFTTLDVETKGVGKEWCKTQEMPYSDQAATFFYEVMLGMCALAERIDNVIAEKPKLLEAIQKGSLKLLGSGK